MTNDTGLQLLKTHLLHIWDASLEQARKMTADVPDERFAEIPHDGAKHPAWVLGHLCVAAGMGAAYLRGDGGGVCDVPAAWMGPSMSAPTADRAQYGSKAELLSHLERTHRLYAEALSKAGPSDWTAEFPNPEYRAFFPTQGDATFYLMAHHEQYHLGQLSVWRRAAGFPAAS